MTTPKQDTHEDEIVQLPYPDTDFSPQLRLTIKRKIESGEDTGMDRDAFFKLLGRGLLVEADPPADCSDMYGVVLPDITISGLFPRTIPREVHDRLREESFTKYAELWKNLAKM